MMSFRYAEMRPNIGRAEMHIGNGEPFYIRGHHINSTWRNMIKALAQAGSVSSIGEFCDAQIRAQVEKDYKEVQRLGSVKWRAESFRRQNNVDPGDDSYPFSYDHDRLGSDPEGYIKDKVNEAVDFLTLPENTEVELGSLLDRSCRACRFGGGRGGLHCQNVLPKYETPAIKQFTSDLINYLNLPVVQGILSRNPSYTAINIAPAIRIDEIAKVDDGSEITINMNIGLFRDVLTYVETKGKYKAFEDLIREKIV